MKSVFFALTFMVQAWSLVLPQPSHASAFTLGSVPARQVQMGVSAGLLRFNRTEDNHSQVSSSYGAAFTAWQKNLGVGLSYQGWTTGDGDGWLTTSTRWNWLQASFKYRLWQQALTPYLLASTGLVFEETEVRIPGYSESTSGTSSSRAIGLGFIGQVSHNLGFSLEGQYVQITNRYGMSLSFFAFYIL